MSWKGIFVVSTFVWLFISSSCSYFKLHTGCLISSIGQDRMTSRKEKGTSQSARLEVGRSYAWTWTSTQTGCQQGNCENKDKWDRDQRAVEREKVQCPSGHWERFLGQFLNKVAGNCIHFAEVIEEAIKVGNGKKLYSVVICHGWSKIEENWFAELMTGSSNKHFIRLTP